jgi:membrane associated rhomboid family serine protease
MGCAGAGEGGFGFEYVVLGFYFSKSSRRLTVSFCAVYRLNTFPMVHIGVVYMIFNMIALTPLLERFESEFGTLVTLALFTGPFGLLPGRLYVLLERRILRSHTTVMGASIGVFLLLSSETMKTHKAPHRRDQHGDTITLCWSDSNR